MSRFTLSKAKQLLATTLALLAGPFVPQADVRAERSAKASTSGAKPPWWMGTIRKPVVAPKHCLQCGVKSGRYTFCSVDHHHLWTGTHPNQGKQPMLLTRRQHRWALAHRMPGGVLMRPWQVIACNIGA